MNKMEHFLDNKAIEQMSFATFANRSYNGYPGKVLKSGICKYFRRELFSKFEWCCIEMLLFGIGGDALVTNLTNRLYILLMEEVSCDSPELVDAILLLNTFRDENDLVQKVVKLKKFCDVAIKMKRARICSYVNNWWKYNRDPVSLVSIPMDKIMEYKKPGDSDDLLRMGELLINCIEDKNTRLYGIYHDICKYDGAAGKRYRRSDPIYLYWEIVEKYLCQNEKMKVLFKFGLEMFHRKQMKERLAFGIWIGLLVINRDKLNYTQEIAPIHEGFDVGNYLQSHKRIEIDEDFVVNDWHVNKNFGKEKFGKVGSFVANECTDLLGDNFEEYKAFYIAKKAEEGKETKSNQSKKNKKNETSEKTEKRVKKEKKEENLELVDFDAMFEIQKIIHDGVCGMKKPCLVVKDRHDQRIYVLKEMSVSGMNKGSDYMFIDGLKSHFGLIDLQMSRFKSNTGIVILDSKIRKYKNNCKLGPVKTPVYFCKMIFRENKGDLVSQKEVMDNVEVKKEMLTIRLFDGLFRSSDNILRNILVGVNNRLISIDEGDIFGKRGHIFDKNDWCLKDSWCRENVEGVINTCVLGEGKKELVINRLVEYGYAPGIIEEFSERYDNYVNIVKKEFNL